YVIDWNATRAATAAGYSKKTARTIGAENLTKPDIQAYIEEIQRDLAKLAGVSALRNLLELKKMAYSDPAELRNSWSEVKDWRELTDEQKAIISEIVTIEKVDRLGNHITILKYKLYDKRAAIEIINKMLGYNAPEKSIQEHANPVQINVKLNAEDIESDPVQ